MHGKKTIYKKIVISYLLVILVSLLGCQNESTLEEVEISTETYSDIICENEKEDYLKLMENDSKSILELLQQPIDVVFDKSKTLNYPDNINFIPTYLSEDNILYGEGDESDNRTKLFLGAYDLNKGIFAKLTDLKTNSKYASIGIIAANKDLVVYEESDQENNISEYYIYDIKEKEVIDLYTISNIPPLHFTQAYITQEGIMFNFYNTETTGYMNMFYSLSSNTLIEVENGNCGFPIQYNGMWYYIKIDNENAVTQLIEFDLKNKNKRVIYETKSQNEYITGLYSNGDDAFLALRKKQGTCLYDINFEEKQMNYLFESEWIESLVINDKYISWLGTNTLPNRNRPQYFLFDIKTKTLYQNDGGAVFLSQNGMAWIRYKREDNEIMKGELYNNKNTSIVFKKTY